MPEVITNDRALLELSESGLPQQLQWHRRRFVVTDQPTPLEDALADQLTHPPAAVGWRFQGTDRDADDTRVFDVLRCDGIWWVARTYR